MFTILVLAVPVILALVPLLVMGRWAAVPVTWARALVLVALAVFLGLGNGMFMLPGALLLLVAAGVASSDTEKPPKGRDAPSSA